MIFGIVVTLIMLLHRKMHVDSFYLFNYLFISLFIYFNFTLEHW